MPAAAAHPRLQTLLLDNSYPAPGASRQAFLGLLTALLQQGRSKVIALGDRAVQGEGQEDSQNFIAAVAALGYPWPHITPRSDDGCGLW